MTNEERIVEMAEQLLAAGTNDYEKGWTPEIGDGSVTRPVLVGFKLENGEINTAPLVVPNEVIDEAFSRGIAGKRALMSAAGHMMENGLLDVVYFMHEGWMTEAKSKKEMEELDKEFGVGVQRGRPGSFSSIFVNCMTLKGTSMISQKLDDKTGKRIGEPVKMGPAFGDTKGRVEGNLSLAPLASRRND